MPGHRGARWACWPWHVAGASPASSFGEYVDYASGARDERPQYQALLKAARKRQVDVVLVWRYDRFARSTQALIGALKEFQALGVDFISYQENIDTTTPQGEMVFTVMASLAQFESALISERVKAGMARAKAQGKRVSRPPIPESVQQQIVGLHKEGVSINQISKRLGVSYGTAWNYVKRLEEESEPGGSNDETTCSQSVGGGR